MVYCLLNRRNQNFQIYVFYLSGKKQQIPIYGNISAIHFIFRTRYTNLTPNVCSVRLTAMPNAPFRNMNIKLIYLLLNLYKNPERFF